MPIPRFQPGDRVLVNFRGLHEAVIRRTAHLSPNARIYADGANVWSYDIDYADEKDQTRFTTIMTENLMMPWPSNFPPTKND